MNLNNAIKKKWSWIEECQRISAGIRRRVLKHTITHGGYLSQACSSAEIFSLLYGQIMRLGRSEGPSIPLPFLGSPSATNANPTRGMLYNGRRATASP